MANFALAPRQEVGEGNTSGDGEMRDRVARVAVTPLRLKTFGRREEKEEEEEGGQEGGRGGRKVRLTQRRRILRRRTGIYRIQGGSPNKQLLPTCSCFHPFHWLIRASGRRRSCNQLAITPTAIRHSPSCQASHRSARAAK